jgi:ABC-2 type transport system permease protein
MKHLFLLLSPRVLGFKNNILGAVQGGRKKAAVIGLVGVVFWSAIFFLSARMLTYFQSVEVIGDLLSHHLLSMILLTFFSLLVFSNILISLSNLYLSADLELCHSSPTGLEEVFLSRWIYTILDSSWMVAVFGLPVMMAYAYVFKPGPAFFIALFHTGMAMAVIASGIGILFTMLMVNIFPAHRTRDILMLLTILLLVAIYIMLRFLRPERLVDPDAFFSVMQYMSALKSTDSPYLPTHWMTEILWGKLKDPGSGSHLFEALLLWSTAAAIIVINLWTAGWIYLKGFSKAQEAKKRRAGRYLLDLFIKLIRKPLNNDVASLVDKDIRIFFRDNTQWSQLFLLGALVVVYLFNFSVLPLEKSPIRLEFLQNVLAFLNMGLAGFVLSAVSVRFIFPSISAEGGAFWIIKSSPVSMGRLLFGKYILYLLPMVALGQVLIIVTNYFLHVDVLMMILSSVTMLLAIPGIIAMAIGFGAVYPRFKYENISQVATGFGGLMYMICSAGFMAAIILIESMPVRLLFFAELRGKSITTLEWIGIVLAFLSVFLIICYTIYKSIKIGTKALNRYERF